ELARIEHHIARWQDRYLPDPAECNPELARHPYLGQNFEFVERVPGSAPWLGNLFNYTFGCLLSLGFGGASISGLEDPAARLWHGVTRSLFLEDAEYYYESLCAYTEREF